MDNISDTAALRKWNSIPEDIRKKLVQNVYCVNGRGTTIAHGYTITYKKRLVILLNGKCVKCGREVCRVVEEYIYSVQKKLSDHDLDKLKRLITTKSWWDITDGLDKVIGKLSLHYPSVNGEMLIWSCAENIWLRRVAIDYQLMLKDKTDTILLEKIILNNLGSTEFFINKAIGWSLREYSKVNPDWVKSFLGKQEGRLSRLSVKEASKYL